MEYFEYTQPNPSEKQGKLSKKGDCVIRAFAIAFGITWLEAYDILAERARRTYNVPNDNLNYKGYLDENGYQKVDIKNGTKRHTAKSFAKSHKEGAYILRLAGHLAACVDGKIRDTWDCGDKSVYLAYKIK